MNAGRQQADEQAALRRVATLAARGARPEEVFAAVAAEAGQLLSTDVTGVFRYDPDGATTCVGEWDTTSSEPPFTVGTRVALGGHNTLTLISLTGRPARVEQAEPATGDITTIGRKLGYGPVAGAPVTVDGRLWGALVVMSGAGKTLPPTTEGRLTRFTELVAITIASTEARMALSSFADEQAALRRVATLAARRAPPEEVFLAVSAEAQRLLSADFTEIARYGPGDMSTSVGGWTPAGPSPYNGSEMPLGGRNVKTLVFETGRPARLGPGDDSTSGPVAVEGDLRGFRSAVGAPISVDGRLWGVMLVISASTEPWPPDTETRLAAFTELAATAIANAEAQAALTASRARIVAATDEARRRVERDLHDGTQQRLISLALRLRAEEATLPPGAGEVAEQLDAAVKTAVGLQEELREISHGLYPAILTDSGLRPALRALARRSKVPVRVDVQVTGRLAEPVEAAAYHAVYEALSNVARHAAAASAEVEAVAADGVLRVRVSDDGRGGADFSRGSGLTEVNDRVEAFGGRVSLHSPPGAGTVVEITLPLSGEQKFYP